MRQENVFYRFLERLDNDEFNVEYNDWTSPDNRPVTPASPPVAVDDCDSPTSNVMPDRRVITNDSDDVTDVNAETD